MGLMDFYFNNIQKAAQARAAGAMNAQAEMMQAGAEQAQGIMGSPAAGPPDMYGNQPQAASGLMGADPNDPMSFISAGMGLMQIPGYQNAANQFLGQAIGNQLGRPHQQAMLEEQRRINNLRLLQSQSQWQAGRQGLDQNQYMSQVNALADDARAAVEPYRNSIELYNTVQDTIGNRGGYVNMTSADDEMLIKAYAKMLLPNEAVMTDDIARIAASGKVDSLLRGLANRVNMKYDLSAEERSQLHESMTGLMQSKIPQYQQEREYFQGRAERAMLNPADILRDVITMDQRSWSKPPKTLTPEQNQLLTEEADRIDRERGFDITDSRTWKNWRQAWD